MFEVSSDIYNNKVLVDTSKFKKVRAAYGLILNDNYILLTTVKTSKKLWFPGGVIDKNETPKEALMRESIEETGIKIKVIKELIQIKNKFYYAPKDEARDQTSVFYICSAETRKAIKFTNPDITDQAISPKWYEIHKLNKADFQDYGYLVFQNFLLMRQANKNQVGS